MHSACACRGAPDGSSQRASSSGGAVTGSGRSMVRVWFLKLAAKSQVHVEGVGARKAGLGQYMPLQCIQNIRAVNRALYHEAGHVQSVDSEHVVVQPLIIPRWAWAIVPVVLAGHLWVRCKPGGVVIEAMALAIAGLRAVFAAGGDAAAMAPFGNFPLVRRNI